MQLVIAFPYQQRVPSLLLKYLNDEKQGSFVYVRSLIHLSLPPMVYCGRRCVLMVSAQDSGSNGPGSSPGQGTANGASLHPGV